MIKTHNCGELNVQHAGEEVTVCGWLDTLRTTGKIAFMLLRDRTGIVQVFLNKDLAEKFKDTKRESIVQVHGLVNKRPDNQVKKEMKTGEIELAAKSIEIVNMAETPLPIEMGDDASTGLDKRLDFRFLDVRREKIKDIFMVRSKIYQATSKFFESEKFVAIQTPKLTASGVESGAEEFRIEYFGKKAALAQSPQVYKQMFVVSGLERVYEIGTIFRAESSHTTRHLTEFTGVDFEMGFIKDENDVMEMIEKYLIFLMKEIKGSCSEELARLNVEVSVPDKIPRYSIHDARKMLAKKGKKVPEDDDLDAEAEKMVGDYIKEKFGCDFVFMLDYPWKKRAFYHMRPDNDKSTTRSFDVLFKGVEIATGAQREHRLDVLEKQSMEKGVDISKMPFYRDIFRYGCPPHGGVGFGLDRITSRILNLENVREAILLPRDPERLTP
ncbi:MAG: aspartate--tRNA(Asn) ligase [Nanoarchaeota archaeon]